MAGFKLALLLCGLALAACTSNSLAPTGACTADPAAVNCDVGGVAAETLGLLAHFCTGASRPDQDPTYIDGFPRAWCAPTRGQLAPTGRKFTAAQPR